MRESTVGVADRAPAAPSLADRPARFVRKAAAAVAAARIIQLTHVAAIEMRASGVRVNAVCPGFADTAMVDRLVPDFEAATQIPFGDLVKAKQGRLGPPEDIAEVTLFLASDRASWITGSHYILDGGLSASLV